MTYGIVQRQRPIGLRHRRRVLGLPIGAKQNYERSWVILRDGKPIGFYRTRAEAVAALPLTEVSS